MLRCLAVVGCLIMLVGEISAAEPDLVFLLIGQSNMAGRAPLGKDDQSAMVGVMLLNGKGEWEAATNPLNRYATDRKKIEMQRLGPGDGFATTLHEALPEKSIGLIVNARGGTKIDEWVPGKPLYDHTIQRINKLDKKPKFAGVIWHQGEGNATDAEYLTKLVKLVNNLRRDLKQPELLFVAGEVYGDIPVNGRMKKLPEKLSGTAVASADELTVFDGVHFDNKSQKTLGSRYAKAWLGLREK
ncbi:MAG: sialate O-acetylesterase [Planctomycetaceae bacterium]|jgi:hypothetical protein|nr:sialate O-acetylesterase [Planctomycetaceae bacterium]MDG2390623.1 sialate O-acetylesterase [Planctomycetaceae bacterium]